MAPPWFVPIVVSALALGVYDLCKKHAVCDNSVMPVLFFATLCGSVFFLAGTWLQGTAAASAACTARQWGLVFLKSAIVASSWTCAYYALRELPISIAAPVRATSPLWTFVGGLFLFHEVPSPGQALAMLAIFGGYWWFSVLGRLEGFSWRRHRGLHLMLVATLLGAGSALYDKYLLATLAIPRNTVQFWFSVDLVAILGAAWFARSLFGQRRPFHWRWSIPATGVLLIVADYAYFSAVSEPGVHIAVLSLIRRCSCLVTFVAGVYVFHEKNVARKAAALALILAGVVALALL